MLVGLALLILIAAGIYTRPRAANAAAKEAAAGAGENNGRLASAPDAAAGQRSSKKAKEAPQPPPAPPAEQADAPATPPPAQPSEPTAPTPPAAPTQSAAPPQTTAPTPPAVAAEPAQPPQPPVPAEPEIQDSDKPDKDKPAKEKSKQKVKKGVLIEAPRPAYPDEIKEQKIEGVVAVIITIGDDGNVIYAKADSGPKELYAVSEAAARKARFQPSLLDGKPAKVAGIMTYNFKLAE
jgi:protein TonB